MKFSILLLSFVSCAQISARTQTRYEIMDQLWNKKATKAEVIAVFGVPSEEGNQGIAYRPSQFRNSIVSAHFFDKNNTLEEQFILMHDDELQKLKEHLKCSWKIQEKVLSTPHTVRTVESGKCDSRNISYDFLPTSVLYEVRWKR